MRLSSVFSLARFTGNAFSEIKIFRLFSTKNETEEIFADLNERIVKYKNKLLKTAAPLSFRSKTVANSIENVAKTVAEARSKLKNEEEMASNAISPHRLSLEVLSNGTYSLRPSVVIRTPYRAYLFNCPEGTSRFLPTLNLRPGNISDIFLTRGTWDQFGGLSSLFLSKEKGCEIVRIHGPINVRQFFECIRPYADADFAAVTYPSRVEERTLEVGKYIDSALTVHYLPVVPEQQKSVIDFEESYKTLQESDIAYLIELNSIPRKIDVSKLKQFEIPIGPHIGLLKSGKDVVLSDGRTIKAEDVLLPLSEKSEPVVLIVECSDTNRIHSLRNNSLLQPFFESNDKTKRIDYIIHFTADSVLKTNEYASWMKMFGDKCQHLVLNGNGPCVPTNQRFQEYNNILNSISSRLFPDLITTSFRGIVSQDMDESTHSANIIYPRSLQFFPLRGKPETNDLISFTIQDGETDEETIESESVQKTIRDYKEQELQHECKNDYPCISFLGTCSAVPSKYRNVSSYLLQLNANSSVMIDCGEGAYGQMRLLFGDEKCGEMLVSLNAVFITHSHQDHTLGTFSIILRRHEEFLKRGLNYKRLILICNPNFAKTVQNYSRTFQNLQDLIEIVSISLYVPRTNAALWHNQSNRLSPNKEAFSLFQEITDFMPKRLFNRKEWGVKKILAVKVYHTKMANGFIFIDQNDRKIVFSGDTKPCDNLVKHGANADILIHEATFEDMDEKSASIKKHSTTKQAIEIGAAMNAKHIILTHFSAKYAKSPLLPAYLKVDGNVGVAFDFLRLRYGDLELLPKLIPVWREIFQKFLFELQLRSEQKVISASETANDESNEMAIAGHSAVEAPRKRQRTE